MHLMHGLCKELSEKCIMTNSNLQRYCKIRIIRYLQIMGWILKMDNSVEFWNKCHTRYADGRLKEETCWENFAHQFSAENGPVLDLACGTGSDSFWLKKRGIPAAACDYSLTGLNLFHA